MRVSVGDIRIDSEGRRLVLKVLSSSRLSYGPMTRAFERLFAKIHDCRFAVFCNSGTSALHIALQALKEKYRWRDGDEVLVPAVTFVATSNIVLHNRMKPVFVDVDPQTYNIDPARAMEAVGRRTRCIIPVHLMGLPSDVDSLRHKRLKIIEDSCETMFGRYRGRMVGSLGDIGCFSTYVAHYIVTGVGGFATTNDMDLAVRLRSLMNHGRDSIYLNIDDDDVHGERLLEVVSRRFRFVSPGHSFRCTELEAAIGLAQLKKYRSIVKARRSNAYYLIRGLKDLEDHLQLPLTPPDRDHMFMLFPLVTRTHTKTSLVNYLERAGIETRDLMPILNQPVYRCMIRGRYPVARRLLDRGFYIGCHQELKKRHLDYIIDVIHRFYRKGSLRG